VKDQHIDDYIDLKAKVQGLDKEGLKDYGNMMKGSMSGLSDAQKSQWTSKQTYIALGNLLTACSLLRIDACPMEGFEAAKYNQILGLAERGLSTAVIATVGYRSDEDHTQYLKKVRKPSEALFESI
jgi:nitroreductase